MQRWGQGLAAAGGRRALLLPPHSCSPLPWMYVLHSPGESAPLAGHGRTLPPCATWVGPASQLCFFHHHLGQPLQVASLDPASSPRLGPLSPAVVQSALCGCSVPSGGVLRCSHKRLQKACFSSPGSVAIKVVWMLPWSPLLFTWPLACALPWHQPSLEEPPLSNFLPHSPVPSVPQPLN